MFESGEMYLETIYVLLQKSPKVQSIDVAAELGYSKPSVSRGLKRLRQKGLAVVDKDGHIQLTPEGQKQAERLYERHVVLSEMLMGLGVDKKTAVEDACRMEHYISDTTFNAIKEHVKQKSKS